MKKIITFLAAMMLAVCAVSAESDINIQINGEEFKTQTETPVVINDRVLVPMREIFEKFGAQVYWENSTKTVSAIRNGDVVMLQIGNEKLLKPGVEIDMEVAPVVINDRTMVPLRAVSSGLGAEVNWDNNTRTVYIDFKESETIPVTVEIENLGTMKAELYPKIAPETVANFVKLANEGFYDGLIFHRVIDGFMIQGGGYDKDFNLKEASSIKGEFASNGFDNTLKHTRGVLSMARTSDPNSASSQFFIMDETAEYLDGEYAAFGKLTDGFDVLDKIAETKTHTLPNGMSDVPENLPVIKSIRADINE